MCRSERNWSTTKAKHYLESLHISEQISNALTGFELIFCRNSLRVDTEVRICNQMGSFGQIRKISFFRFCRPILDIFGFTLLTNKEASTALCSVVKQAGSGIRARRVDMPTVLPLQ